MTLPAILVVAAFPVVGLLLAGYGVLLWLRIQELRRRGQTSGVVVDNEVTSYVRGRSRFRPVVRFHDGSGQEITFVGAQGRSRSYVPGSRVVVVYDPDHPRRAAVGTGGSAVTYVVTGVVIAAVGGLIYLIPFLERT